MLFNADHTTSPQKFSIPVIALVVLVLTGIFSFTVSMAQTRIDGPLANESDSQPEIVAQSPIVSEIPVQSKGNGMDENWLHQEMLRVASQVYDQSLGSLKITLAIMIGIIGGGMIVTMFYLGYVDQQRKQRHEYLLANAEQLARQIQASAHDLRRVYQEAREWERDLSEKMRERYEIHHRKNKQLLEELEQAQGELQAMEQEIMRLSQTPIKRPDYERTVSSMMNQSPTERVSRKEVKIREIAGIPVTFVQRPSSDQTIPATEPDERFQEISKPTVAETESLFPHSQPKSALHEQRRQIIDKIHQTFERELEKNPDNPSTYLNWGNACLKVANKLKGEERSRMLEIAREKWMMAERCHAGTAKRQLSVLNAITGLEQQSQEWAYMNHQDVVKQTT